MTASRPPGYLALAFRLAEAGLIQFGRFTQPDGSIWPVQVRLGWLPSYPDLLREVAVALAALLDGPPVDRLLTTPGAIPLGTALSLHTGLPMTYASGTTPARPAAFTIEGAYDVGHPTALLADVLTDIAQARQLIELARHVGLDVSNVLVVFDVGLGAHRQLHAAGYQVRCLLTLSDLLDPFVERGLIPDSLRAAIQRWLADPPALTTPLS